MKADAIITALLADMGEWLSGGSRSWCNLGPHEPYTPDVIARMDAAEVAKRADAVRAYAALLGTGRHYTPPTWLPADVDPETGRRFDVTVACHGLTGDLLDAPADWLRDLVRDAGVPCVADCGRLAFRPWRAVAVSFDPDLVACSAACAAKTEADHAADVRDGVAT